ncbi:MAG: RecQ family zinc-binding domain-containing protein, partial [Actinomycetota bacterium]|nr:RecQ family zinc-binding domain-containing protein [Actinomycetota bacterium]
RAACRTIAGDAQRARWRRYRAIWAFVETGRCRRAMVLAHFGDDAPPAPTVGCCDVCDPALILQAAIGAGAPRGPSATAGLDLPGAIVALVEGAEPPMGQARIAEVLRGGSSKEIRRHRYDGLPGYATFGQLTAAQVLAAVDALVVAGRLVSTGGRDPTLRVVSEAQERLIA